MRRVKLRSVNYVYVFCSASAEELVPLGRLFRVQTESKVYCGSDQKSEIQESEVFGQETEKGWVCWKDPDVE